MKKRILVKVVVFLIIFSVINSPVYGAVFLQRVNMKVVGDIMVHDVQYRSVYNWQNKSYDFSPMFAPVREELKADLLIGNLETTLGGQELGYSGYPRFNSPDSIVETLKSLGFDLLFTANNHSFDKGEEGLKRTLEVLNKNDIHHTGTFDSPQSREKPCILKQNGISFGFLNYTYGTNGLRPSPGKEYLINYIDLKQINIDIKKIRPLVDLVVVGIHFGTEYQREPNDEQKFIVHEMVKAGADIILGSHPHVLQPYEIITVDQRECFVVYSLGNFVSGQKKRYTDSGAILELVIEKSLLDKKPKIVNVNYLPIWTRRYVADSRLKMEVVPVRPEIVQKKSFSPGEIRKHNQALEDVKEVWSPLKTNESVNMIFSSWANKVSPITNPNFWLEVMLKQISPENKGKNKTVTL